MGENLMVRIGKMRSKQSILCEFCEVRWTASASSEVSGAAKEMLKKLALPVERSLVSPNYSAISAKTPFCSRHTALQVIQMYEDVINARGL